MATTDSTMRVGATIAVFGASGDLTARKLMPSLFHLWRDGFLADECPIVGVARRDKTDEQFRNEIFEALKEQGRGNPPTAEEWEQFSRRLYYRTLDLSNTDDFRRLDAALGELEERHGDFGGRIVYLAIAPNLFLPSVEGLSAAGMVPEQTDERWLRVVFEKPFGEDLESARELMTGLSPLLREDQIYRIDHYLGKETVQNILLFRFGNAIFEPLLNRNHVDHVQITVAESIGMERGRGGFYDQAGALRDVLQNHVLQLMCLIAMEPPALFRSKDIHEEKLKVLQALSPGRQTGNIDDWAISGQYTSSVINGERAEGYTEEDRVDPDSRTETFVAMEVAIDNWRWAGVPFFFRTGKRLPSRVTEIAVQFKHPPLNLFTTVECDGDMCAMVEARPNMLLFRIQPKESISVRFGTKRPGMQYQIHPVAMDYDYEASFTNGMPEAYERLLLDVIRGDSTLFMRSDEVEQAWAFVDPILSYWEKNNVKPKLYRAGTWGPDASEELLRRSGRQWRTPTLLK